MVWGRYDILKTYAPTFLTWVPGHVGVLPTGLQNVERRVVPRRLLKKMSSCIQRGEPPLDIKRKDTNTPREHKTYTPTTPTTPRHLTTYPQPDCPNEKKSAL